MQRVIVTVKRQGEAQVRDLEVPAEVAAERLSKMIAQALRWDSDPAGQPVEYEVMAEPPGRTLQSHETLADAGAWDGSWLVFQRPGELPATLPEVTPSPSPSPPPSPPSFAPPPAPAAGPVAGWRSLDIDLPTETEQERKQDQTSQEETGFVWKRLD